MIIYRVGSKFLDCKRIKRSSQKNLGNVVFYDLGDPLKESLEKLDNQFDLVILTEYMLESLVLLADLLCIPYNVLFTKRVNSKSYDEPVSRELTPGQHRKFEKFFKQDFMMYDFFNRTLQGKRL